MNVISLDNQILMSSVSTEEIDGHYGLVMESRGGKKGSHNERNTDYLAAINCILTRLVNIGVTSINVYVVSSVARKLWEMDDRALEINGSIDIPLSLDSLRKTQALLRGAQQNKKSDPSTIGGSPTKRILITTRKHTVDWDKIIYGDIKNIPVTETEIDLKAKTFDPEDAETMKEKIMVSIAARRGQAKFRKSLLQIYEEKCVITETNVLGILEAAHIYPYKGEKTNHFTNGLLLRADIHTLFDLGLIGIDQKYQVVVSSALRHTEYEKYHGKKIFLPEGEAKKPSLSALKSRPLPYRQS